MRDPEIASDGEPTESWLDDYWREHDGLRRKLGWENMTLLAKRAWAINERAECARIMAPAVHANFESAVRELPTGLGHSVALRYAKAAHDPDAVGQLGSGDLIGGRRGIGAGDEPGGYIAQADDSARRHQQVKHTGDSSLSLA